MLAEMAVADAYAIPFEFVPDTADRKNDLSQYYQHPTYGDMTPGHYTDDTQRSIANTLVIIHGGLKDGRAFSPLAYLEAYQYVFQIDPRPGYSKRFEAFLKENTYTRPQEMALKLNRKPTNGAVMGAAVFGWLPTVEQVMLAASCQALSTHSYQTIPYAQIVALSAFYAINNVGKFSDLNGWLYRHLHEQSKALADFLGDAAFNSTMPDKVTMGASSAVKLMLYALPRYNSLSELTKLAVNVGGDTDSAAAIMVAVASESLEYVDDFPAVLYDGLENGEYGREYLQGLDKQLRDGRKASAVSPDDASASA